MKHIEWNKDKLHDVNSAWSGLENYIIDIINRYNIKTNKALEFGVERGYSTYILSQIFEKVDGVDIWEGFPDGGYNDLYYKQPSNEEYLEVVERFKNSNVNIIKSDFRDYIKDKPNEYFDLIHIDIVHTYEDTYEAAEWAIKHSDVVILHDITSYPMVNSVCEDLSKKYGLGYDKIMEHHGLGILYNKKNKIQIYDCFTFFNELDLLEIRLNYLNDVVDYFVLVEADKTHSGEPKPYHYEENKERFKEFNHKIIHIKKILNTDGLTFEKSTFENRYVGSDFWSLENEQRDAIMEGLIDAKDSDVILIGDLDEIPKKNLITEYVDTNNKETLGFVMRNHIYYLNNAADTSTNLVDANWWGTCILRKINIRTPQNVREDRNDFSVSTPVYNSGWHFTFLGGIDRVLYKTKSFAHSEYHNEEYLNKDNIKKYMEEGKDFIYQDVKYNLIDITQHKDDYPDYLINNLDKYNHLIKPTKKEKVYVYDCFAFFNELDLLEIRLNYLNDVVDYFVLVESDKTFSGKDKPYYYEENKERFKDFHHKIIHIKTSPNTEGMTFEKAEFFNHFDDYWKLENEQRNSILLGLTECNDEDVIIISDLDEIPKRETIKKYLIENKGNAMLFKQQLHKYFINNRVLKTDDNYCEWFGSGIVKKKNMIQPQDIRNLRFACSETPDKFKNFWMDDGGWHFTFLGGVDKIIYKIKSWAHSEFNNEELLEKSKVEYDIYHSSDPNLKYELIDIKEYRNDYPDYLVNNLDKYTHLISPINKPKMVLFMGYAPSILNDKKGGSEMMAYKLCESLKNDYEIHVFGCHNSYELKDGVYYHNIGELKEFQNNNEIEILLISRYVYYFLEYEITAKKTFIWVHDYYFMAYHKFKFLDNWGKDLILKHDHKINGYVCLTQWHKEFFHSHYGVDINKIHIIGNAIDPNNWGEPVKKIKNRFIWVSRHERGLNNLLRLFPKIQNKILDAELFIYGPYDGEEEFEKNMQIINSNEKIHYGGILTNEEIIKEFQISNFWFYPTEFAETYCISALEAQMSGCIPIASNYAGLSETIHDRGVLLPFNERVGVDDTYEETALNNIINLIEDTDKQEEYIKKGLMWAENQTFENRKKEWIKLFYGDGTASGVFNNRKGDDSENSFNDLVSIIIPYNKDRGYLNDAVKSVKKQTHKNIELILSKGDNNKQININKGIKKSKGNYIYILDEDDILCDNSIEMLLKNIDDYDMIHSNAFVMDSNGNPYLDELGNVVYYITPEIEVSYYEDSIKYKDITILPGTILYKKSVFDVVGLYNESDNYYGIEDLDFLIRCYKNKKIKIGYTPDFLMKYRFIEDSLSKNTITERNRNKFWNAFEYREEKKPILCFFMGYAPFLVENKDGWGGSELTAKKLSEELIFWYDVYVFGAGYDNIEHNGVKYRNVNKLEKFQNENEIDVMLVVRYLYYFLEFNITANKTYLWAHDYHFLPYQNFEMLENRGQYVIDENDKYIDGYIALTNWHKDFLSKEHNIDKNKICVIGNAIDKKNWDNISKKHKNRFIWTSSPDRGLNHLLDLFPLILEKHPDAELYIYGHKVEWYPINWDVINNNPNIHYMGKRPNEEVLEMFKRSEFWFYPTDYYDTFNISALEAQMSKTICITSKMGGISETVGDRGILIDYYGDELVDYSSTNGINDDYKNRALKQLFDLMENEELKVHYRNEGYKWAKKQTWEYRVKEWLDLFDFKLKYKDFCNYFHNIFSIPKNHIEYLSHIDYKPKVIYDIGSNFLHWSREAKKIWSDSKIICFDVVEEGTEFYKEHNFEYYPYVLSDVDDKEVVFYDNIYKFGGASYYRQNPSFIDRNAVFHPTIRKTKKIDTLIKQFNLPKPDLIKLDVQGAELDILMGMKETLNYVNHIIIELQIEEYNIGVALEDESIKFINELGFELVENKFNTKYFILNSTGCDADYHFIRKDYKLKNKTDVIDNKINIIDNKNKMRFHIPGIFYTKTTEEFVPDPFTQQIRLICKMLTNLGHDVFHYGNEGSNPICKEHISVASKELFDEVYGHVNWKKDYFSTENDNKLIREFNKNAIREINKRKQKNDFLLCPYGSEHKYIADNVGSNMIVVEPDIGYTEVFAPHKVFTTYSLMHQIYGRDNLDVDKQASLYDAVIPHSFDIKDYIYSENKDDYYFFMGRNTPLKGLEIAIKSVEAVGGKLIVAGQGKPPFSSPVMEYIGVVNAEERAKWLSRAKATFVPTLYLEKFGMVVIESLLCGTPVITTDLGSFTELVPHGKVGYRCRTLKEFVIATKNIDKIKPKDCRDYAEANFSTEKVSQMFQHYFSNLYDLYNGRGWYDLDTQIDNINWLNKKYIQ